MPVTVILEGPNGVGKTTLIKALKGALKDVKVRHLSFPSPEFEKISDTPEGKKLSYIADFERVMSKELQRESPDVYLIDRGFVSTVVYGGDPHDLTTLRMGARALLKAGGSVLIVNVKCNPYVAAVRLLGREKDLTKGMHGGVHNAEGADMGELFRALLNDLAIFDHVCLRLRAERCHLTTVDTTYASTEFLAGKIVERIMGLR